MAKQWGTKIEGKTVSRSEGQAKREQSNKGHGKGEDTHFHKFYVPEGTRRMHKSSLLGDIPEGTFVSFVGVGKSGKTTACIQEAMKVSSRGEDVLYIYNESSEQKFMRTVERHRKECNISMKQMEHITFQNARSRILGSANYQQITHFIGRHYVKRMEEWMLRSKKPKLIILDSFSRIVRKYVPQSVHTMQTLADGMEELMERLKSYPLVILVNQKSGGHYEAQDESVMGGYGITHELDSNIVFRKREITPYMSERYRNMKPGTLIHTVQITEMRDLEVDTSEYLMVKQLGWLKRTEPLHNSYRP